MGGSEEKKNILQDGKTEESDKMKKEKEMMRR
jgi:hypothetical protein